jgi:cephalosporin-C deacetylase-like acetyl esterase
MIKHTFMSLINLLAVVVKFRKYFVLFSICAFSLLLNTANCKSLNSEQIYKSDNQATNGPSWVKKSLSENKVFETPVFQFTSEYDQYRQYPNIRGLFFNGLSYHGKPTKVFCWYGVPETLQKGKKAPAVVLVHGGGGTIFPEWIKKWTDHGYVAISIGLEGQVPGPKDPASMLEVKYPTTEFSGPFRQGIFLDLKTEKLTDQWFYHAVADIILSNSLLRSFPEVDQTKIGITGISWGGILTNVVTGIDNRFAFAIPVYGCGYLHEAPTCIKQLEALTPESKLFYLQNWEPSLYVPLQKQPTLFIDGTNDGHFSMNSFTKTYLASVCEKYLHVEYEMPHGHPPGWNPEVIYVFADYVTRGTQKPVKFIYRKDQNGILDFTGEINEAFTYYTTDTADWDGKNYKWIKTGAQVSKIDKTIVAEIPEEALYYFVNGTDVHGIMYSSPMKKVLKKK